MGARESFALVGARDGPGAAVAVWHAARTASQAAAHGRRDSLLERRVVTARHLAQRLRTSAGSRRPQTSATVRKSRSRRCNDRDPHANGRASGAFSRRRRRSSLCSRRESSGSRPTTTSSSCSSLACSHGYGVRRRASTCGSETSRRAQTRSSRNHASISRWASSVSSRIPICRKGSARESIVSDRFVCVVRKDHPVVKKRLSLDEFVSLPHPLVAPRGESGSVVDTALARIGKKRRVAARRAVPKGRSARRASARTPREASRCSPP